MAMGMSNSYLIGQTRMIQRDSADYAVVVKDIVVSTGEVMVEVVDATRTGDLDSFVADVGTSLTVKLGELHDMCEYPESVDAEQSMDDKVLEIQKATAPGLPTGAAERKAIPVYTGFMKYFPKAMAAVAELSRVGNEQHNPGKPLHWDRSKSGDELDACMRHMLEAGTIDTDGIRHSTKGAWRAMANLEKELENAQ